MLKLKLNFSLSSNWNFGLLMQSPTALLDVAMLNVYGKSASFNVNNWSCIWNCADFHSFSVYLYNFWSGQGNGFVACHMLMYKITCFIKDIYLDSVW